MMFKGVEFVQGRPNVTTCG